MADYKQDKLPGMPRDRDLMSPEARYKRGYTPERQKAIVEALKGVDVQFVPSSIFNKHIPSNDNRARHHVTQMLANSTVDPKYINTVNEIRVHEGPIDTNDLSLAGRYIHDVDTDKNRILISQGLDSVPWKQHSRAMQRHIRKKHTRYAANNRNELSFTLLHELGHHVEYQHDNGQLPSRPDIAGWSESYADDFALSHYGKQFKKHKVIDMSSTPYAEHAGNIFKGGRLDEANKPKKADDHQAAWAGAYIRFANHPFFGSSIHREQVSRQLKPTPPKYEQLELPEEEMPLRGHVIK